nr:hypothetical protein [Pandoravirus aubagnensis]
MDKHGEAKREPKDAAADANNKNDVDVSDSDDKDSQYIDVRMRVPKALAKDLLCEMMSEYSEAACCATWADDIDIDIDADARKRLGPEGDVVHCSRDMLNVALAQIHQHCGGWWSYRAPRANQQGQRTGLIFYPLNEWVALPVPCWTRDRVAYPNPDNEGDSYDESGSTLDSPESNKERDHAWWQWFDSLQNTNAASADPSLVNATASTTSTADTPVCLPEGANASAAM